MNFHHIPIAKISDFWDKHPCNIRHSNAKVGTKKYFTEVERRKYFVEPHIPRFTQFEKWKGKNVLEIGCGIGTDTINFARAGAHVTAVDVSKKSLGIAQKRAQLFRQHNRIKFYHANAEHLSKTVPVKRYDLIYSFGVIHHTPHPEKIIEEIKKYCSPKTIIKIMVYYRYSWKVLRILLTYGKGMFWKLSTLIARYSEAAIGSPVTYIYSKPEVKKLLKGFTITTMSVDHIFPYDVSSYKNYQYKKVWYFRIMPQKLFHFLKTHFGWHLLITARMAQ